MKPIKRLEPLLLLGVSMTLAGCRGGQDRQMIFTAPRVAPVQVEPNKVGRVKAPFVDVQVPASKQIPASKGVDVPIVEPQ